MSKDKGKRKEGRRHGPAAEAVKPARPAKAVEPSRPADAGVTLPATRAELLALHAATRRRRNAAELGSDEHRAAVELIGRIEVEVARIERAMDPPLV
jgi:hypothetical protein